MKSLLIVLAVFSFCAYAGEAFSIDGWSPGGFSQARVDAQDQADRNCGGPGRAIRVGRWVQSSHERTVERCSGRADDRDCTTLHLGTDYIATASFRCR